MKLKSLLLFFILINFLFFLLEIRKVTAQQSVQNARVVCLNAEKVENDPHAGKISVDPSNKLLSESQTYVFECVANSYDCTTGNSQLDRTLFGKDNLTELNRKYGYRFEGTTLSSNPIMSDKNGFIPQFIWRSYTPEERSRIWLALNYFPTETDVGRGGRGSQQLLTFNLREASNTERCVSLSWDPYGIVFDSITLEPVSNAKVTLLRKRPDGSFSPVEPKDILGGLITNPQITKEDGFFNFIVPDGIYKLVVESNEYIFPEKRENINRNYLRIYSDIYPDETGEEIIQAGAIQHRDIPVRPKSLSQNNRPILMEVFYFSEKDISNLIIKGRVSHPFSKIHFYSLNIDENDKNNPKRGNLIKTISADKLGRFSFKINQSNFRKDEFFGEVSVEKVNLTRNESFSSLIEKIKKFLRVKKVDANIVIASSYRFNPILNYIEGYAYDSQGKIIPNAKVYLVPEFSERPFYTTNADDKGYFKITSEFIPFFPYKIQYENPSGKKVSLSTTNFITQNKDFIEKEKIDLNRFKVAVENKNSPNNNLEKDSKSTSSVFQKDNFSKKKNIDKRDKLSNSFEQDYQQQQDIRQAINSNFIVIVFLILILLILFFVILFFYIKKKNNFSS